MSMSFITIVRLYSVTNFIHVLNFIKIDRKLVR